MFLRLATVSVMLAVAASGARACDDVKAACDKKSKSKVKVHVIDHADEAAEDRAFFGIQLGPADDGIEILEIIEDSPAESAGFRGGDVVTRFDGRRVESVEGFVDMVKDLQPGDDVTVEFVRDGRAQSRTVTLGSRRHSPQRNTAMSMGGPGAHMIWLPDEVRERIHGLAGQDISIEVECEDGRGLVTIERDGEEETFEIECPREGEHTFMWHGDHGPGAFAFTVPEFDHEHMHRLHEQLAERMQDLDIDVDLEGLTESLQNLPGNVRLRRLAPRLGEPTVRFREDSRGRIEVVIRKGDSELVREFENAEDLEDRAPDLYRRYRDLND